MTEHHAADAATPSRGSRWLPLAIGLVAVALVAVLAVVAANRDDASTTTTTTTTIEGVDPDRVDPRSDAQVTSCGDDEAGGTVVRVINGAESAATYLVAVRASSPDGTVLGTGGATLPPVDAGADTEVTIDELAELPDDARCEVVQVIRTPVGAPG